MAVRCGLGMFRLASAHKRVQVSVSVSDDDEVDSAYSRPQSVMRETSKWCRSRSGTGIATLM